MAADYDVQEAAKGYSASTKAFLDRPKQLLINGKWVNADSGATFSSLDPATEQEIAQVAEARSEDVDKAVKAARTAFELPSWSRMTAADREKLLHRIADLMENYADELAEIEAIDNGKSVVHARHVDVAMAIDCFRYMAGWPTKREGATIPVSVPTAPGAQFFAYTQYEAVGVCAQIIPWNFPLLMAAWKIAPALAMGCTVILKPAEETPLSALRLGEIVIEAGVPDGVVNILPGFGHTAGAALAAHPGVDKVAFTGSTEVGRLIVQAAAGNLKKVSLELGGKSPAIILADADLDLAIPGAAGAIFFNQGQVCTAGSRLFVAKKVYDKVVEGISTAASAMKMGHGLDVNTQMGPLISQIQFDRVQDYVQTGQTEGAKLAAGGMRHGSKGYFVTPTVFADTNPTMRIVREEIFGPVVCVQPFNDVDDIVPLANDTAYGLAGGIWGRDLSAIHRVVSGMKAGTIWVNCYNALDSSLPFGGFKQSGWGRELGRQALDLYTESKSVCMMI